MKLERRDFLRGGLAASAALPFLGGARLAPAWLSALASSTVTKKLVVVQITGGWDLFNQIVPVNEPNYYAARPTSSVGIADNDGVSTLRIAASIPQKWAIAMQPFRDLYDRGQLAIINDVGHTAASLSHFDSEKIWYAGNTNISTAMDGWLARYLNLLYSGGYAIPALDLESRQSGALTGFKVPVVSDLANFGYQFDKGTYEDLVTEAKTLLQTAMFLRPTASKTLQFIANKTADSFAESEVLRGSTPYIPSVTYPVNQLSTDLQVVARYITGGLGTHIYYLSTGNLAGFDLHSNMANSGSGHTGTLATQLRAVTGSIKAFLDDLYAKNTGADVCVLVFSEFSRRFGVNGSMGTDHGHGGVSYLAGKPVIGGFYGPFPAVAQATQPFYNWYPPFRPGISTDFRSIYATIMEKLFGVPSAPVLGQQFPLIGML